jgi:hypothetical protein
MLNLEDSYKEIKKLLNENDRLRKELITITNELPYELQMDLDGRTLKPSESVRYLVDKYKDHKMKE